MPKRSPDNFLRKEYATVKGIQRFPIRACSQHASGYQPILNTLSAINADDWRKEIIDYLKDPSKKVERRVRFQATKYVLLEDKLYYRTIDGVLLKCLSDDEAKSLMGEIHERVCGAHQSAFKMKWMIRRNGYYWPTILEDCFKYFKGCQGCQEFGNVQRAPASAMNPIIKPWPFRGWAIDLIGQIYPPSSKGISLSWLPPIISPSGLKLFL